MGRPSAILPLPEPEPPSPTEAADDFDPHRLLQDRIARILETMDPAERRADAGALLDSLADTPDGAIRQLPSSAQSAIGAMKEDADPRLLRELFEGDPALAQGLLRIANSAAYGAGLAPCRSIRDGVLRVGSRGAQHVLVAHAVEGLLCRPGRDFTAMVEQVWSHMTRTADIARRLAPALGASADEALTLGLLHDAGKLVVFDRIAALRADRRREIAMRPERTREILRALHEPLGALAALKWGLDTASAVAVATHHRDPAPARRDALGEVLFLAERLDLAAQRGRTESLAQLWEEGRLSGDSASVESLVAVAA